MEVQFGGFQEAILEIVQVKEDRIRIECRLGIAIGEVQFASATYLNIRQLTDGALQELLLLQSVSAASLTTATDSIKQRHGTQVSLQITQLVLADSQDLRHRQLAHGEMTCQIDEGMILVTTRTYTAHHTDAIGTRHSVIHTVTTSTRQLFCRSRFCTTPFLI